MKLSLICILLFFWLTACSPGPVEKAPYVTATSIPSPITTQGAIQTPTPTNENKKTSEARIKATRTALLESTRAAKRKTLTAIALTLSPVLPSTPTPKHTTTAECTPTPTATFVPFSPNDGFVSDLERMGYELYSSPISSPGSFVDQNGLVYSVYIFWNPALSFSATAGTDNPKTWIIAFYRWDGQNNELIRSFYAPSYWKNTINPAYPFEYEIINWDAPWQAYLEDDLRQLLKLKENTSDINRNGKPEFVLQSIYCPVSCTHPRYVFHFYEIQNTYSMVDLAENLPGFISLRPHSTNPLNFYVPVDYYYQFYQGIFTAWIYEWDGEAFLNVTIRYADEYLALAEESTAGILEGYGGPFDENTSELNLLKVLIYYEKAGLRREAIDRFLEITDLSNWSDIDDLSACWLQIARAQAQEEYRLDMPFSLPPTIMSLDVRLYNEGNLISFINLLGREKYDFSRCELLEK